MSSRLPRRRRLLSRVSHASLFWSLIEARRRVSLAIPHLSLIPRRNFNSTQLFISRLPSRTLHRGMPPRQPTLLRDRDVNELPETPPAKRLKLSNSLQTPKDRKTSFDATIKDEEDTSGWGDSPEKERGLSDVMPVMKEEEMDGSEEEKPWVPGEHKSVYVQGFDLALDTVLENESHLFSDEEMEIFARYRSLPYEAQYLYGTPLTFTRIRTEISVDISDCFSERPLPGFDLTRSNMNEILRMLRVLLMCYLILTLVLPRKPARPYFPLMTARNW